MNPRIVSITTYLAIIVTICDQITKRLATQVISAAGAVPVTPFLNIDLTVNHGMNFYMLGRDFSGLVSNFFIIFWLVVFFSFSRWRLYIVSTLEAVGIGLIMGGIIGDLVDRLRFGRVVSFLDFHGGDFHFYTFNLAECAMVAGMLLLVLDAWSKEKKKDGSVQPKTE
jgi:signal peptidase II